MRRRISETAVDEASTDPFPRAFRVPDHSTWATIAATEAFIAAHGLPRPHRSRLERGPRDRRRAAAEAWALVHYGTDTLGNPDVRPFTAAGVRDLRPDIRERVRRLKAATG